MIPARRFLTAAAVAIAALAASAAAQAAPTDSAVAAMTRVLATELRCPVCQGLSIADSPAELSLDMRAVISDQLREGKSPAEVREYFVAKYGEWILLQPRASGFNLVVYVLPVMALALGFLVVWRTVRRWTTRDPGSEYGQVPEGRP